MNTTTDHNEFIAECERQLREAQKHLASKSRGELIEMSLRNAEIGIRMGPSTMTDATKLANAMIFAELLSREASP